jgi:type I restriction enzyme S subunit
MTSRWGDICTLEYGRALRNCPEEPSETDCYRVYGTNGPIGWTSQTLSKEAGVIIGRKGAYRGVHFSPEPFFVIDTAYYLCLKNQNIDLKWAYYKLLTVDINRIDVGAAIPTTNRDSFYAVPIRIPSLPVQQRIASVLSSYDDLIDNNLHRIKLLEESARQLYREWFVRLRFPGYEHTEITKGVPDGWEKKKLGDICEEIKETVLPENVDPDTPYIGLEHIPRKSITLSTWGRAEDVTSAKHRYRAGEILFGKIRPYFHKVGIALTDGVASSDAIVIRAFDDELQNMILLTVSSDHFVADTSQRMKEGSKMPRADWTQMQQWPVLKPKPGFITSLNDQMNPIVAQLKTVVIQNIKLKQARDILLPKLMSGEVEV